MGLTSCRRWWGGGANGESTSYAKGELVVEKKSNIIVNKLQYLRLVQRSHLVGLPQSGPPLHDYDSPAASYTLLMSPQIPG